MVQPKKLVLNEETKKNLKIFLLLLLVLYISSAIFGLRVNKILANELGDKYSCFRYDNFEKCTTSEYIFNSIVIFPRHLLIEIPVEMIINFNDLFDIFISIGIFGSIIVISHIIIVIVMVIRIIRGYKT